MSSEPLKARPLSGVAWTALQSWGSQLITLAVFAILARLLDPSDFGLVALAGVLSQLCMILVDQGLAAAIIQRRELHAEHLNSAFWLNVLSGLLLSTVVFLSADIIAAVFRDARLAPVVAVISLNFTITSLIGVQEALLRRAFRFKLLAIRTLVAATFGGAVGITLALKGFGVMSLVGQQLAGSFVSVALLWRISDWRPQLSLSKSHAHELIQFGSRIIGTRTVSALTRRADDFLIGYFLGATQLGFYSVAYKIFKVLIDVFTKIVTRVALPTFSAIQHDVQAVRDLFGQAVFFSVTLGLPSFVLVALSAGDLVPTIFGDKWAQSIPVLRMLTIAGILQSLYLLSMQVMIATGRPNWAFRVALLTALPTLAGFIIVIDRGILAVAAVLSIVSLAALPVHLHLLKLLIEFGITDAWRSVRVPVVSTAVMTIVALTVQMFAPSTSHPVRAASTWIACIATYVLLIHKLHPGFRSLLRELRTRSRAGPAMAVNTVIEDA